MINLLPPKERIAIDTAKRNTILRRYLELSLVCIVLLTVLIVGSYYFLQLQANNAQKTLDINNQKLTELEPSQKEAEQLSATIKTIATLFSREIDFSKMLTTIGQLMPEKAVLSKLELSSVDSKAPLNITAEVDTEEKAAVLRNNLASSDLFEKADIVSITKIGAETGTDTTTSSPTSSTNSQASADSPYQFTVIIDAYFKTTTGAKK